MSDIPANRSFGDLGTYHDNIKRFQGYTRGGLIQRIIDLEKELHAKEVDVRTMLLTTMETVEAMEARVIRSEEEIRNHKDTVDRMKKEIDAHIRNGKRRRRPSREGHSR